MPLAADRNTPRRKGEFVVIPVEADTKIYAGSIVCANAAGNAVPGSTAVGLKCIGRAEEQADNTSGVAGDITVRVMRGVFKYKNSGADPVDAAGLYGDCYIVDDETVAATDGAGTRSRAGKVLGVDTDGVWVEIS